MICLHFGEPTSNRQNKKADAFRCLSGHPNASAYLLTSLSEIPSCPLLSHPMLPATLARASGTAPAPVVRHRP